MIHFFHLFLTRNCVRLSVFCLALLLFLAFLLDMAFAVGVAPNNFAVACFFGNKISVFEDAGPFAFVGDFDGSGSFIQPMGLDFTATGNVASTSRNPSQYREFDKNTGVLGNWFADSRIGSLPLDSKIGDNGNVRLPSPTCTFFFSRFSFSRPKPDPNGSCSWAPVDLVSPNSPLQAFS
jgi:hypothetical protein